MLTPGGIVLNALFALGLVLFVLDAPVRQLWARLTAVLLMNGLTVCYVVWRYGNTLPAFGWELALLWPWLFFCCGLVAVVYEVWSLGVLTRSRQPLGGGRCLRGPAAQRPPAGGLPTVDVFIPTYSEGADILEETIAAALALDYPADRLRVWILDDGRRPWLKDLCRRRGAGYFARPSNEHGKAGNLNYALPRTAGDFLLVIDADFVLHANFLYRTLGFLLDRPEVALVQTPQLFRNPDPVQHNLGAPRLDRGAALFHDDGPVGARTLGQRFLCRQWLAGTAFLSGGVGRLSPGVAVRGSGNLLRVAGPRPAHAVSQRTAGSGPRAGECAGVPQAAGALVQRHHASTCT